MSTKDKLNMGVKHYAVATWRHIKSAAIGTVALLIYIVLWILHLFIVRPLAWVLNHLTPSIK